MIESSSKILIDYREPLLLGCGIEDLVNGLMRAERAWGVPVLVADGAAPLVAECVSCAVSGRFFANVGGTAGFSCPCFSGAFFVL